MVTVRMHDRAALGVGVGNDRGGGKRRGEEGNGSETGPLIATFPASSAPNLL